MGNEVAPRKKFIVDSAVLLGRPCIDAWAEASRPKKSVTSKPYRASSMSQEIKAPSIARGCRERKAPAPLWDERMGCYPASQWCTVLPERRRGDQPQGRPADE